MGHGGMERRKGISGLLSHVTRPDSYQKLTLYKSLTLVTDIRNLTTAVKAISCMNVAQRPATRNEQA